MRTDLPIIDATEPITFKTRACDRQGANPRDPENCVVARGWRRTTKLQNVKVGAVVAYAEMEDHIKRFFVADETREITKAYDLVGFYPTGVTIKLLPPPPKRRLGMRKNENRDPSHKGHKGDKNATVRSPSREWLRHVNQKAKG